MGEEGREWGEGEREREERERERERERNCSLSLCLYEGAEPQPSAGQKSCTHWSRNFIQY